MEILSNMFNSINEFVNNPLDRKIVIVSNTTIPNMGLAFSLLLYKEYVLTLLEKSKTDLNRQICIIDDVIVDRKIEELTDKNNICFKLTNNLSGSKLCIYYSDFFKALKKHWNTQMKSIHGNFNLKKIFGTKWTEVVSLIPEEEFENSFDVSMNRAKISLFGSIRKKYNSFKDTFIKISDNEYDNLLMKQLGRLNEKVSVVRDSLDNGSKISLDGYDVILFSTLHRCRLWAVNIAKKESDLAIAYSFSKEGEVKLMAASINPEALDTFNKRVDKFTINDFGNSVSSLSFQDFVNIFYNRILDK